MRQEPKSKDKYRPEAPFKDMFNREDSKRSYLGSDRVVWDFQFVLETVHKGYGGLNDWRGRRRGSRVEDASYPRCARCA